MRRLGLRHGEIIGSRHVFIFQRKGLPGTKLELCSPCVTHECPKAFWRLWLLATIIFSWPGSLGGLLLHPAAVFQSCFQDPIQRLCFIWYNNVNGARIVLVGLYGEPWAWIRCEI